MRLAVSLANSELVMLTPLCERARRLAGHQRLAAQQPVLIREGDADDLEPLLLDQPQDAGGRLLLLVRPGGEALDEGHARSRA